jgi:hypothetical protein
MKINEQVFIGHGRSLVWLQLKEFIEHHLNLEITEFNSISPAGTTTTSRLEEMLATAELAFLIMTSEDEQENGKVYARLNVIHEAGLFQGRLGFNKAIILREEGCEEFSNILGLNHISFPKDNIKATFEDIRKFLEREQAVQRPIIDLVNVRITNSDPGVPRLKYPLKCYVTLRNKSSECIDVSLSNYLPGNVTLKDFSSDVLQLRFKGWWPQPGVERISVLPGQLFRAWVGPNERKFNEEQVNSLRGRIGTLVFSINGKPLSIDL